MLRTFQKSSSITLDRRKFLGIAAGLVAAGVLPKSVLALAAPYSFKQGAYDVTVASDGTFPLPLSVVSPAAKIADVKALLSAVATGDTVPVDLNVLVLKGGSDVILIDTGTGAGMGVASSGQLGASLSAAGTTMEAVTKVIYTHAHPDHLWGTGGADGKPVFPNATFHMSETEFNFWSAAGLASKMPQDMQAMVTNTQAQLAAIKDKVAFFKPGQEVVPGLVALDTAGHTPGHASFEMAGGDGLIVVGDAITVAQVFFKHPDWVFGFDADGAKAAASRKMLLDMAATGKKKMLGYHWPYPGIGMAEAKDGAYQFVAVS